MRRFTARKRPAKNFTHRCKGVAFMFGKGQQRPQRRLLHYRRIGRRHAVNVNQATWRHGDAFMPGDASFTKCDGAGGVIKQQWEIIFTRENHTERIGAKAAVATVERCNHWNTDHANKVDRDKPRRCTLLRPVTDTADMMRVM